LNESEDVSVYVRDEKGGAAGEITVVKQVGWLIEEEGGF
jgi:hypothetical protein